MQQYNEGDKCKWFSCLTLTELFVKYGFKKFKTADFT